MGACIALGIVGVLLMYITRHSLHRDQNESVLHLLMFIHGVVFTIVACVGIFAYASTPSI